MNFMNESMIDIIEDARNRPDYTPPSAQQVAFADKVFLLTMNLPHNSFAKLLAIAYAQSCAQGHLSNPFLDE